jgi:formate hydrogenlyase subunit 6/NADH:ubiquinone oxidoreductase subunit I
MPKPVIDKAKCTVCDVCKGICPVEVFSSEASPENPEKKEIIVSKPEECIGCRACEAQCPNSAIVVKD